MHSTISRLSSGWKWEGIRNCQLGKYGNGIKVSDGNGNEVNEMGGNWDEKSVPTHLYLEVCSRQGAVQIHIYLTLPQYSVFGKYTAAF